MVGSSQNPKKIASFSSRRIPLRTPLPAPAKKNHCPNSAPKRSDKASRLHKAIIAPIPKEPKKEKGTGQARHFYPTRTKKEKTEEKPPQKPVTTPRLPPDEWGGGWG